MIPRRLWVCGRSQCPITQLQCAYAALLIGAWVVTHLTLSRFGILTAYVADIPVVQASTINARDIPSMYSKMPDMQLDKQMLSRNLNQKGNSNTIIKHNTVTAEGQLEPEQRIGIDVPQMSQLEIILNQNESTFNINTLAEHEKKNIFSQQEKASMYGKSRSIKLTVNESYPRFSKNGITPQDFKFLLPGRDICGNSSLLFIVLVPTIHAETEVRHAIRNTWGSYKGVAMRIAFLLGAPPTAEISTQIHRESAQYGDIVMADFTDSYTNLTYKVLMGLRWAGLYCHWVDFIVKADSDMFLNISAIVDILRTNPPGIKGNIYGSLRQNTTAKVMRDHKWKVSKEMYPFDKYPPFVVGACYVLSSVLAIPLYTASQHYPYLRLEDVLITGCLAEMVGAQHVHVPRFVKYRSRKEETACECLKNGLMTLTHVKPKLMHELWSVIQTNRRSCRTPQ